MVVEEGAAAAANPDLDEIVIKQELDTNGKSALFMKLQNKSSRE